VTHALMTPSRRRSPVLSETPWDAGIRPRRLGVLRARSRPAVVVGLLLMAFWHAPCAGLPSPPKRWPAPSNVAQRMLRQRSRATPCRADGVQSGGGDAGTLRLRGGSWGAPDYGITSAEVTQLVKLREMLAPELEEMGDAGLDFQSDERMYRVYRTAGFSLEASVKYFRGLKEWRNKALPLPSAMTSVQLHTLPSSLLSLQVLEGP